MIDKRLVTNCVWGTTFLREESPLLILKNDTFTRKLYFGLPTMLQMSTGGSYHALSGFYTTLYVFVGDSFVQIVRKIMW